MPIRARRRRRPTATRRAARQRGAHGSPVLLRRLAVLRPFRVLVLQVLLLLVVQAIKELLSFLRRHLARLRLGLLPLVLGVALWRLIVLRLLVLFTRAGRGRLLVLLLLILLRLIRFFLLLLLLLLL